MIRRHVVEALTKLIIRRGLQFGTTNVRVVAYLYPQVQLIQSARVNACNISPKQRTGSYMDMQAPCGLESDPLVEIDIPMERDDHGLSSSSLPSVVAVPEDGASTSVLIDARNEKEKLKRAKKKAKKPRGRKKKPKVLEGIDDLMAELPFAGTEVWKDLDFATSERLKKKRKFGESAESEEDAEKKKKKKRQPTNRPNYFVSIPITNPEIRAGVEAVQAAVIQRDPRLSRALIPPATLHITLLVTHLENEEQVTAACCALEESRRGVCEALGAEQELLLPFSGVSSFRNEVAFIPLATGGHCNTLTHLAEAVRRTFVERGIAVTDDKAFKPHLTFMKLSRAPKLRSQGIKKLDPALYSEFCEQAFGIERVSSIDLCSMLKRKGPDGHFHREKTITFGARKPADEEELARVSRRVVDEAVQRAVQQYLEETQETETETQHSNGDAPPPKEAPASPNANSTNTPTGNNPNATTTTTMPSSTSPTATQQQQQQQQPPTINANANK
ncbi:A-kinase anchor protein 7 isoform X2 [Engraulis encrasicolus]|uniref:A-kinase anchor protein 7 isoform X2 n=1 Tax=Engraulis encrasicolus TaxID=184585 RepID=UPI002FCF6120